MPQGEDLDKLLSELNPKDIKNIHSQFEKDVKREGQLPRTEVRGLWVILQAKVD